MGKFKKRVAANKTSCLPGPAGRAAAGQPAHAAQVQQHGVLPPGARRGRRQVHRVV